MATIQLELENDNVDILVTILKNLRSGIIDNININRDIDLDIEPIEKDSSDYRAIAKAKSENNPQFSISEAKRELGLA